MFDRFKLTVARWEEGANMILAQMLGQGNEDDDQTAERVDDAPLLGQLGFAVFPVVRRTLRGLGWRHGNEVWILKLWDKARKIFDMEEGETRVYAVGHEDTRMRLKADGSVTLEAEAIRLGGGTGEAAARRNDTTSNGTISFLGAGNSLSITYRSESGGVQQVVVGFALVGGGVIVSTIPPTTLQIDGRITSGSSRTSID